MSYSRHESESEWPAVSSKWLESVKSHSTGLETKSSCGLDCENSPSTGLVYKLGGYGNEGWVQSPFANLLMFYKGCTLTHRPRLKCRSKRAFQSKYTGLDGKKFTVQALEIHQTSLRYNNSSSYNNYNIYQQKTINTFI